MNAEKKVIYLPLMGRIGNQLFEYAFAYAVQCRYEDDTKIIIDESDVMNSGWINSLREYTLPNVEYISDPADTYLKKNGINEKTFRVYKHFVMDSDPQKQYRKERLFQKYLNKKGVVAVEKGYLATNPNEKHSILLYGYFQSERYFEEHKEDIEKLFDLTSKLNEYHYPEIDRIRNENSVCISIKIEHNADNQNYFICDREYYNKAVEYIEKNVEKPLYFVCSDNVNKALELLPQCVVSNYVRQPMDYSAAISLAAMSCCRHFIINNTSFGWWAQFLSKHKNRMVIAPSRWMNNRDPVSIYDNQKGWILL